MTPKALPALLSLGVTWGASFLFIKVIVDETSPLEVAEGRMFFGSLAVGAVLAIRRTLFRWPRSVWAKVAVWSLVAIVIPFILIAWAVEHVATGTAAVLISTMPLFTALFAAAFLMEEQLTPVLLAGLAVGIVGVIVLTGGDTYDFRDSGVLGQLAMLTAAACYGAGGVYARTLLKREDPLALSGGQLVLATALVLPVMLGERGTPDYSLSVEAWLSLVALGIWTGIGMIVYLWLVDNVGSVRSSLIAYIVPVVGLFLGWAVLDESIGVSTILGTVLIIAGVAAAVRGQAPSRQRLPVAADTTVAD